VSLSVEDVGIGEPHAGRDVPSDDERSIISEKSLADTERFVAVFGTAVTAPADGSQSVALKPPFSGGPSMNMTWPVGSTSM
jgi:hypothetical protein